MGLWSFLGVGKKKVSTVTALVIGEDRSAFFRQEESTGVYLVDHSRRLAYDSFPQAIGTHSVVSKGKTKNVDACSVLYEPMSRPWSFPDAKWVPELQDYKKGTNKKTIVLADARAEGYSMAIQRKDDEESQERLQTILVLLCGLFAVVIVAFLISSGVFKGGIHLFPGG